MVLKFQLVFWSVYKIVSVFLFLFFFSTIQLFSMSLLFRRFLTAPTLPPFKALDTIGRLNHIAIAVPSLEVSASLYRDVLHAEVSAPQDLPEHGVTVVFVKLPNTKIELLHPFGPKSPIQSFLDKNPSGGIHHFCIETFDIEKSMEELKKAGKRILDPKPKIGAHGNPVVFLHPKDMGGCLVELELVPRPKEL